MNVIAALRTHMPKKHNRHSSFQAQTLTSAIRSSPLAVAGMDFRIYRSAGTVVITAEEAGLWTDSRYFLQAARQIEGTEITLYKEMLLKRQVFRHS